jgi:S-DNA-T family DNA segregation ATPase FtsK/SpoIIIE
MTEAQQQGPPPPPRPVPLRVPPALPEDGAPVVDAELVPVDPPEQPRTIYGTVLTTRTADRRPIVPAYLRNRQEAHDLAVWLGKYGLHVTAYHAVRLPLYAGKLAARAPLGVLVAAVTVAGWVFDREAAPLRRHAVEKADAAVYMKLTRERNARVRQRGTVALVGLVLTLAAVTVAAVWGPWWLELVVVAAAVVVFGKLGTPPDRRIASPATVSASAPPRLTAEVVTRARQSLGIAAMTAKEARIAYPSPITRDGPGWRADVDLPFGVTVSDITERRERLASGLRRPVGCVWPEPSALHHAGRLILWVGDQALSEVKPAQYPWRKSGTADVFAEIPFGTDQRGRPVGLPLVESNMLIGSLPGAGKTASLRCVLLGCALDPTVELHIFELKGSGDLESFERIAHAYGSGVDDETIGRCLDGLRWRHGEVGRRAEKLKKLRQTSRDLVPDSKVTRELANRRSLGLHPVVFVVDEAQELFSHGEFGKEAGELATAIIKRGRALGVMLILATQRPDKDSLPTGVSANVGTRFCLRVMGQVENDMVLGTSAYKNGIRATTFTRSDRGIGYLVGATDAPVVVKTYYLDAEASDAVVARAFKEPPLTPAASLLDDLRVVFATITVDKVWSEDVCARLAEHRPELYREWTPEVLAAALKPYGITTGQVWGTDADGVGRNRRGLTRQAVLAAVEREPADPPAIAS